MSLKEWERDVVNRQRNIVFPDTNLNEGRFYRNIASGKAVLSAGQKISLALIVLFFVALSSIAMALAIGDLRAQHNTGSIVLDLWVTGYILAILLFWIFLAVKGILPSSPKRTS